MQEKKQKVGEKAYEKVIEHIKNEIWRGSLKRGERLPPERELAELLNVSRNSVREAIRTLGLMGFVSSTQGAGNFVTCDIEKNLRESLSIMLMMGETNYLQISQLRCGIESINARLAAERILPSQAARMMQLTEMMRDEPDPRTACCYDQELHVLLCEASGNRLIKSLYSAMLSLINDFISTMYVKIDANPEEAAALMNAHIRLVDSIAAHDPEGAVQAMRNHFDVVDRAIGR